MIKLDKFSLENGLRIIVHQDKSTPIVAFNILYDVGSKDENPDKTGFAHLFEHLMFGGSINIPKYDQPLQKVGGENNAFTSSDITNYYLTLPKQNLETAFWLESDRMLSLAFNKKSLQVQKNVVTEEFKQVFLNQPYGDAWLLLRPLAYKVHPYQWSTIGKEISHITDATMEDVKNFYNNYYNPENAIVVIGGDVELDQIKELSHKWFGSIPNVNSQCRNLAKEPVQNSFREETVRRDVPVDAIYKAFHMCSRLDEDYHATDLLSDILSNGDSSRLYQQLVKKQTLFTDINAFITGEIEEGLFVITGKILKGVDIKIAEEALNNELSKIINEQLKQSELQKVKNKVEATLVFSEVSILNKVINLAYMELLGDANLINQEVKNYGKVTTKQVQNVASTIFDKNNCSTLYYLSN
ncbi:MAG: insulinase family protein [Bacteroidetes bacterium]|nr:insulinase family protein [Bacteroidota bacterium]